MQKAEAGEKYRGMAQGRGGSQSAPNKSYRSTALEAMYRGSAGRASLWGAQGVMPRSLATFSTSVGATARTAVPASQ